MIAPAIASPQPHLFPGNTAMAQLMRNHDWAQSSLGLPADWPLSLRSIVNLMLGSAFPMFIAWGPRLSLLYNDGYADLMGVKHPSSLGQPLLEVWHEIRGDVEPLARRSLDGESFYMENLPLRMQRRGFEEDTWFTFSYSPALDDEGRIAGVYCACVETTGMVLAERQQRFEQQRLQTLFQQTPGFTAVLRGPNHVFEIANDDYLKLTGFRDVIGKAVSVALPEVVDQGFIDLLDNVRRTGQAFVGKSMRIMLSQENGGPLSEAWLNFVYQPITNANGEVDGIFVQGYDVTEEQRTRDALLAFSNSIPAIAWVAAPSGELERVNSQWSSFTGQPDGDALGRGWSQALHPDDRSLMHSAWQAARSSGSEWQVEHRLRRRDGAWNWFLTRVAPQLDATGGVLRWFGTTTDIESARAAGETLRNADRQKDEFLATLAHELRNPLAPIRTAVQLLASPASAEATRSRATSVIERQVGHMAHLLDDLIDIARITQRRLELKKSRVALDAVVQVAVEAARPGADAKRHRLEVHLPAEKILFSVDQVRLAQVLSNLLNNAAKYTDAGGHIRLEVCIDGGWLVFKVTDNGIGLTADAADKVFAMFAQEQTALHRSEGGLGIGLALSRGLVELHGGTITATSAGLGQGSSFTVRLPLEDGGSPALASEKDTPRSGPTSDTRTVLLADDNRDAVDTLAEFIQLDGHAVHIAYDGIQAVEQALRLKPDVMVLDIGMPGLTGYEVAQRIRAQPAGDRPLLIAATGWGQEDDRQRALVAGFDMHLTKPFDPRQLLALIGNHQR